MPTYEIRISQGSNASKYAVDLPNEATARDEVIAIVGDLARDFARELLQDPWNIEIVDPARRRILKLTAHAELGSPDREDGDQCAQPLGFNVSCHTYRAAKKNARRPVDDALGSRITPQRRHQC
jgi:hypothetical protein